MNDSLLKKIDWLLLPLVGIIFVLAAWAISSSTWAKELPSPLKTWQASKTYILEPFAKRGEMDQGILRFTWYSLTLVAKGYALALIIGTPIGFFLGLSKPFAKTFDPIIKSCARSRRWHGCRWAWFCSWASANKRPNSGRCSRSPCAPCGRRC
jgi:ABC-type nitrate/sulfonate/bicarbonate transport system permease component